MTDTRVVEAAGPSVLPSVLPDSSDVTLLPSCAPDTPLEALEWLGETVEEVAEGLRARGIKGSRRILSQNCPLARYLQQWWPSAVVACGTWWLNASQKCVPTPLSCQGFENAFDHGEFPDLVAD